VAAERQWDGSEEQGDGLQRQGIISSVDARAVAVPALCAPKMG